MTTGWYTSMIQTLCERAGIPDWEAVEKAQQIDVNGSIVALFPDSDSSTTLVLYVELSTYPVDADINMLKQMLESNTATPGSSGFFGLLPNRGIAIYRTSIAHADNIPIEEVKSKILDLVSCAATQFHEVMSRRTTHHRKAPRATVSTVLSKGIKSC